MIRKLYLCVVLASVVLSGCAGTKTFSNAARAGDTVTLAVGWNKPINRNNIKVVITQGASITTYVYPDARVRAVAQMYPDPAAKLLVGAETGQQLGVNASTYGNMLAAVTSQDKDMAQTMVMIDLPATLIAGTASVDIQDATTSASFFPPTQIPQVTILAGVGTANTLDGSGGSLNALMLQTLERDDNSKAVVFAGSTVPYGIQLELVYNPATTPWLVNPRGDVKNVAWNASAGRIKIIVIPSNQVNLTNMAGFKFLVAGVTGLAVDLSSIKAFDANGNTVSGVTAALQ